MSKREAARLFGIDRKIVVKILQHSVPNGYRRSRPRFRPRLDAFTEIIDKILEDDKSKIKTQRHTAKRIHARLRDEHGFSGGITIVTDYVREQKRRSKEVFVPLAHAPGHAQVDFGETLVVIGGTECKLHYFVMVDIGSAIGPSDTIDAAFGRVRPQTVHRTGCPCVDQLSLIKAYQAETTEAFGDGPNAAFAFFGGVPLSVLYDNTRIAVARICGDGTRLLSDLDTLMALPPVAYDACEKVSTRARSISMVRYRSNDYSVPVVYAHHEVQVRGYIHEVAISCGPEVVARHQRSYDKADMIYDPEGSFHALIEAVDERRLQRLQKQLAAQDLLIIDELGFVPLSKTGTELLFEVISQRYERGSIIITSNLPFEE